MPLRNVEHCLLLIIAEGSAKLVFRLLLGLSSKHLLVFEIPQASDHFDEPQDMALIDALRINASLGHHSRIHVIRSLSCNMAKSHQIEVVSQKSLDGEMHLLNLHVVHVVHLHNLL